MPFLGLTNIELSLVTLLSIGGEHNYGVKVTSGSIMRIVNA